MATTFQDPLEGHGMVAYMITPLFTKGLHLSTGCSELRPAIGFCAGPLRTVLLFHSSDFNKASANKVKVKTLKAQHVRQARSYKVKTYKVLISHLICDQSIVTSLQSCISCGIPWIRNRLEDI